MRIFVAGSGGQLAQALVDRALSRNMSIFSAGRPELDLEAQKGIGLISNFAPDAIVNAAAYTAVDAAETDSARAFAVNCDGATWLADVASTRRIPFIHVSTDYVFDGLKPDAYTEDDPPSPQGEYGRSKLAGERGVLSACGSAIVVRTAWVYSRYAHNFVKTMLRLAGERDVLRVVNDQIGNPTSADDLSEVLLAMAVRAIQDSEHPRGIYHVSSSSSATWFEFAQEIMRLVEGHGGRSVPVVPVTTSEFPTQAKRPFNSQLDCRKLLRDFGLQMPRWTESLPSTVRALI